MRPGGWLAVGLLALAGGCGRLTTTTLPSPEAASPDPPGQVTINAAGVRPNLIHLFEPRGVLFTNNDARVHDIRADNAKNVDAGCSVVNVGRIEPGQTGTTGVMSGFLGCYFRDEMDPANPAFQGFILSH
jgi:hypothetical protein